jgi:hypothetical protein
MTHEVVLSDHGTRTLDSSAKTGPQRNGTHNGRTVRPNPNSSRSVSALFAARVVGPPILT